MKLINQGNILDDQKEHEIFYPKLGVRILVLFTDERVSIFNNITEMHWRYLDKNNVAFESDVHGTGGTRSIDDIDLVFVLQASVNERYENYEDIV